MITVEAGNVDTRPLELDAPLTLDIVKQALIEEFRIENVEVDIESDTFKVGGGVTSLMSSATPCVVIYNRKYRKKYNGKFRGERTGKYILYSETEVRKSGTVKAA